MIPGDRQPIEEGFASKHMHAQRFQAQLANVKLIDFHESVRSEPSFHPDNKLLGSTYYLPYRLHATTEQFNKAYPTALEFFQKKRSYDPRSLFQNQFYLKYGNE